MLTKLRNGLLTLFVFVSMLVGFWIYTENMQEVSLVLFGFMFDSRSLGFWVIAAFVAGISLGLFCNILVTSWLSLQIKKLRHQLNQVRMDK